MPIYIYLAKDPSGNSVKGREIALSEQEVSNRLSRKNLVVISISKKKEKGFSLFPRKKVKSDNIILFCKQLSTLLRGGVPIVKAIDSIAEELDDVYFYEILKNVSDSTKGGESLSGSMKKFPLVFTAVITSMVEAGEKAGTLDVMLERMSSYLKARDRLGAKIKAALFYPAFILAFFTVAMAVITLVLIPRFKVIYGGLNAKLPLITQIVFGISDFVVNNIVAVVLIILLGWFIFHRKFLVSEKGRYSLDEHVLKFPVFGNVIKNASLSRFSRTLATLLGQGVPIVRSLELVGTTAGNSVIKDRTTKVKNLILDGDTIPDAIRKADIFPSIMVQMITVGVESGRLPELLEQTADFYEERVDDFVGLLTTMMEPILLVVLGSIIGTVIIALYMPIFKMSQIIR